jgi:translation initiation factor 1
LSQQHCYHCGDQLPLRPIKQAEHEFCCNGCIINDLKLGKIIQLQGDQRENAIKFFLEEKILIRKSIKLHGI